MRIERWVVVVVAMGASAFAQDEATEEVEAALAPVSSPLRAWAIWDNDSVYTAFFDTSDRYETNLARIAFNLPGVDASGLLDEIPAPWMTSPPRGVLGVSLGQFMYTPADLTQAAVIPFDRAYGGWMFVGPFLQRRDDESLEHLELDLGATGDWSVAEDTQKWIHDTFSGVPPQGWDNQIDSEFGVNLQLTRLWRVEAYRPDDDWSVEVIPEATLVVGTIFRHAQAGATLRAGWRIPDDFGVGRADLVPDVVGPSDAALAPDFSAYAFVRLAGRGVEHNTFLDGSDFHDGQSVDKESFVGRAEIGFAVRIDGTKGGEGWGALDLAYTQSWTTHEFQTQRGGGHHGAYTLMYSCACR